MNKATIAAPTESLIKSNRIWIGLVVTVVVFSVLVKLGFWQLSRGQAKQRYEIALEDRQHLAPISLSEVLSYVNKSFTDESVVNESLTDKSLMDETSIADDMSFNVTGLRIQAKVEALPGKVFVLDNQTYQGSIGYLAYQVVETQGLYLLLERGFVAGGNNRNVLPKINWLKKPSEQTLTGRLYQRSINPLSHELGMEKTIPIRIQNLNIEQLSEVFGVSLLPFVFQPQKVDWPYSQPWKPVPLGSSKHFGYAVQWFSMAAVFAGLCAWLAVKQRKRSRHK